LTLSKLRDKATIDEAIESVNLVFPDQYGRLNGLKLNAEYFLEVVEGKNKSGETPLFEYKYNPFRFDVNGTQIEFQSNEEKSEEKANSDKIELPKTLNLSPDLQTLKEMTW
jgi:hypothetical protein